ncbi:hypothetical protein Btru_009302 [Bulinus truncatus]|nr:hypothetical protein Btru_009302 [Bulinus truncatus]
MMIIKLSIENVGITILDFKQSDCKTTCNKGLLAKYDKASLTALLNLSNVAEKSNAAIIVSTEMKTSKSNRYFVLEEIKLDSCLNNSSIQIRCTVLKTDLYKIEMNIQAKKEFSYSSIMIAVSTHITREESNNVSLPVIFDPFETSIYLNEKRISHDCVIDFGQLRYLSFCCDKNTPTSTLAILKRNEKEVVQNESCVSYYEQSPNELPSFILTCDFCKTHLESITCSSTLGDHPNTKKINDDYSATNLELQKVSSILYTTSIILVVGIVMTILIIFGIIIFVVVGRKYLSRWLRSNRLASLSVTEIGKEDKSTENISAKRKQRVLSSNSDANGQQSKPRNSRQGQSKTTSITVKEEEETFLHEDTPGVDSQQQSPRKSMKARTRTASFTFSEERTEAKKIQDLVVA